MFNFKKFENDSYTSLKADKPSKGNFAPKNKYFKRGTADFEIVSVVHNEKGYRWDSSWTVFEIGLRTASNELARIWLPVPTVKMTVTNAKTGAESEGEYKALAKFLTALGIKEDLSNHKVMGATLTRLFASEAGRSKLVGAKVQLTFGSGWKSVVPDLVNGKWVLIDDKGEKAFDGMVFADKDAAMNYCKVNKIKYQAYFNPTKYQAIQGVDNKLNAVIIPAAPAAAAGTKHWGV